MGLLRLTGYLWPLVRWYGWLRQRLQGKEGLMSGDIKTREAHNDMLIARIKGVPAMPATPESEIDPRNPFSRRSDNRATLAEPVPRP